MLLCFLEQDNCNFDVMEYNFSRYNIRDVRYYKLCNIVPGELGLRTKIAVLVKLLGDTFAPSVRLFIGCCLKYFNCSMSQH